MRGADLDLNHERRHSPSPQHQDRRSEHGSKYLSLSITALIFSGNPDKREEQPNAEFQKEERRHDDYPERF